ncbi:chymotrypsin-2 isoform X2 [Spodoptera frugiperda]|uniref:Chymotrypsin-2 isoform X1 n=1 Tax=Spodoptera frugiperda TaxID=7108 RepID=A0A9R0ESV3_SPOFR|nr:chymotrypsin-2 isoform X1 [Spodoptera frugiperda]XP_050549244.1 chymotrypsin-2 isoform X2 [Spodoptera frugiperda]
MIHIRYFVVTLLSLRAVESAMEGNVVGGNKADITDFPHSAFLGVICQEEDYEDPFIWICGGSILNQKIILTAAHCFYGCLPERSLIGAYMGHVNREKGFSSIVKSYSLHKDYYSGNISNDIGLAVINSTIKFGSNIKRIAVVANPPYYEKAQIAGWGLYDEINFKVDNILKYVNQYIWKRAACKQLISKLSKGTICASSGDPEAYSSRGDSGSALVVRGFIQIGIVSYKVPLVSRSLVVYTDTGYFYDWIKEHAKKLYCPDAKSRPKK